MREQKTDTNPAHTLERAERAVLEVLGRPPGAAYTIADLKAVLFRAAGWDEQIVQIATMYAIDTDLLMLCEDGRVRLNDSHRRHHVARPSRAAGPCADTHEFDTHRETERAQNHEHP